MKLKPVHDKIVIKPTNEKDDNVTEGGIILPETVNHGGLLEGEVIAAGNVIYSTTGDSIPIVVEVGDTVIYSKQNSGQEYTLNGEDVLIISQNEVLSILEK